MDRFPKSSTPPLQLVAGGEGFAWVLGDGER